MIDHYLIANISWNFQKILKYKDNININYIYIIFKIRK